MERAPHHYAACFLTLLMLVLSGCDDPAKKAEKPQETPDEIELPTKNQKASKPVTVLEPTKKDLRIIGDGKLPAPKITEEHVERIKPDITADEKNAQEKARIPKKPDIFSRPIAQSAGMLISGTQKIELGRIETPSADAFCNSKDGRWPCGNFAKSALQRLIRARSITCDGEWKNETHFHGDCKIGKRDLATWLVKEGWAKTDDAKLKDVMQAAKNGEKGLWRK